MAADRIQCQRVSGLWQVELVRPQRQLTQELLVRLWLQEGQGQVEDIAAARSQVLLDEPRGGRAAGLFGSTQAGLADVQLFGQHLLCQARPLAQSGQRWADTLGEGFHERMVCSGEILFKRGESSPPLSRRSHLDTRKGGRDGSPGAYCALGKPLLRWSIATRKTVIACLRRNSWITST